jgi:hypothetical protein
MILPLSLAGAIKTPAKKTVKKAVANGKSATSKPAPRRTVLTHAAKGNEAIGKKGRGKTAIGKTVKGRKGGKSVHAAPVERSQAAPTPDRYREIQQALVAKGYLKSEPSGVWDADTQEAMRRFQADQKLDETGKINALSLISLGLGPQH